MRIFEARRMLAILDQLVEPEIIVLQAYGAGWVPIHPFWGHHREVLFPATNALSAPQQLRDSEAIQRSYHQHLEELGLVEPKFEFSIKDTRQTSTGKIKVSRSRGEITRLGRAFLRYIDEELERDPKSPAYMLPPKT